MKTYSTHILVRDDLNVLHVASGLEDLTQDVFCHPRIQSSYI